MKRKSGKLHVVSSISRPSQWWEYEKRVKGTKPDGTRAGMGEPVAGPRGADKRTAGGEGEGEKV